jgi:hypothetical protein
MDNTDLINQAEQESEALRLAQEVEATAHYSSSLQQLLPKCAEIIGLLQSGTFISSSGHIKLHKELSRHSAAYQSLLEMIGHELVHHPAGFFYLQPKESQSLNTREKQIAASIFVLIEFMSDQGHPVEAMINAEDPISAQDIELLVNHHKERLEPLSLGSVEEFIANGIRKLVEAGVMQSHLAGNGQTAYTLGIPAYYYLDITRKLSKQAEAAQVVDFDEHELNLLSIDDVAEEFLDTLAETDKVLNNGN